MGNKVPDLRGLFLRGYGGKSSTLLNKQNEAVHIDSTVNVKGKITFKSALLGMASNSSAGNEVPVSFSPYPHSATLEVTGLQIAVSTGDETRPVNMAVRYLIRALP